jgi:GT2 family glycosyltransferase
MKRTLLAVARRLLPRRLKRLFKRVYDPNQTLPHPDQLVFSVPRFLGSSVPRASVSVIVVTWNSLPYTRACLASLPPSELAELIVVDNGSVDGTVDYLKQLAGARVIFNECNVGFPAAVNRGLAAAEGNVIVLLNNDTIVPAGTLSRLARHALDETIGLVVAATNFSGNESRVEASYSTLEGLQEFADERARTFADQRFDIGTAAMYCVAARREVFDRVGPLDEQFTTGTFEDDDYSERVRHAGYRVVCAQDAFVHHYGGATFSTLSQQQYFDLEARNRALFEAKWRKERERG